MSSSTRMEINCPRCRKNFTATVWKSINTDLYENVQRDVINGKLFEAVCPFCKYETSLSYDILYHDLKRQAMIWALYPQSKNYKKNILDAKNNSLINYSYTRMVSSIEELREKVSVIESGRDDRLIELYKYYVLITAHNDFPDLTFTDVYYMYDNGKEVIYLYSDDGNYKTTILQEELYNFMRTLFDDALKKLPQEKFPVYDQKWAELLFATASVTDLEEETAIENKATIKVKLKKSKSGIERNVVNATTVPEVKFCRKCGNKLLKDSSFCSYCGTKVIK